MRTNQQFLPVLASVACVVVLALGVLGRPAAAQPPGPRLALQGDMGQFVVAREAASFMLAPRAQPAEGSAPSAAPLNEGFEGSWPAADWQVFDQSSNDGGTFLWGKRACDPHTGQFALMSHGGGAQGAAKACGSQYPNNMQTWAVYGPVDLSNATSAALNFYIRGRTQSGQNCPFDGVAFGASTNGTNFNGPALCGGNTTGPDGNGYTKLALDLQGLVGQPQVWLALIFFSDASITDIGYTLDDLALVVAGGTPTNTPTRTATPTTTATATPTRTPGQLLAPVAYLPLAVKAQAPSPTPTPTTQPTLTPTTQPGGKPRDGHWAGSTSQGKAIGFDVLSGGTRYNAFAIGVQNGGCGVSITISSGSGGFPIANNQFTLSGSSALGGSYVFAGTFSSPSSATGTFTFNGYNTGACVISASGTWQASHP